MTPLEFITPGSATREPGPRSPVQAGAESVDQPRIAAAVREILHAIGEDPDRDGLLDTPARVARAYAEMFAGLHTRPEAALSTVFDAAHDELILVKDIETFSVCEHHLLPFHGVTHVGYVPGGQGRVTGLSKLARLVDGYARRPQIQERLTSLVADALMHTLGASGAIVVMECEHLCMSLRGIRKPGATTVTSAVRGSLREEPAARQEAMARLFTSRTQ